MGMSMISLIVMFKTPDPNPVQLGTEMQGPAAFPLFHTRGTPWVPIISIE